MWVGTPRLRLPQRAARERCSLAVRFAHMLVTSACHARRVGTSRQGSPAARLPKDRCLADRRRSHFRLRALVEPIVERPSHTAVKCAPRCDQQSGDPTIWASFKQGPHRDHPVCISAGACGSRLADQRASFSAWGARHPACCREGSRATRRMITSYQVLGVFAGSAGERVEFHLQVPTTLAPRYFAARVPQLRSARAVLDRGMLRVQLCHLGYRWLTLWCARRFRFARGH